jgi:hypothetical protein
LKRESSPPLFFFSTTPAKFLTTSLYNSSHSSLQQKTTHHSFSGLLSPPSFFLRAELFHKRKVGWAIGVSGSKALHTITVFCFSLWVWVWHVSASFSLFFLLSSWKTWEKLLDAKVRFEMERLHMRPLPYLLKEKQKHIGVSFEFVSPTLIQLLPLVENKTQKKIGVGEVQKSLERGKTQAIRVWRMLLAEIFRLMARLRELSGKWWGGFCIWSLGLAEERVSGMEVFLCWFVFGHCRLFWGIWWGGGGGELSVLTELECAGVGRFWSFSSLEEQTWHGFTHEANRQRLGSFYQGFEQFYCILDVFWRNLWQDRRVERKSDSAGKTTNLIHTQHFVFSSLSSMLVMVLSWN